MLPHKNLTRLSNMIVVAVILASSLGMSGSWQKKQNGLIDHTKCQQESTLFML